MSSARQDRARPALLAACLVAVCAGWLVAALAAPVNAQPSRDPLSSAAGAPSNETPEAREQLAELGKAATRLPLAAVLATILALRPRRRGTPERRPAVIQTQIILAVIGGLVMMVVGASLARAFGIVGAAGLVRYRAKVEDPKDAGVMLSTLAVGLACGVGVWMLAIFGTLFILIVLWVVESFEPVAMRRFVLRVKTKKPDALKAPIERLLKRRRATYEVRAVSAEELHYELRWPFDQPTDELPESIRAMDAGATEVDLEAIKDK